jgi:hypothetical protein
MLGNLLFSSFSNAIDSIVRLDLSAEALMMSVIFSAAGAVVLGTFTGSLGHLTVPLNFFALLVGSVIANCLLDGIDIPAIQYQQEILVFTVLGLITGSFAVLWCVRPKAN